MSCEVEKSSIGGKDTSSESVSRSMIDSSEMYGPIGGSSSCDSVIIGSGVSGIETITSGGRVVAPPLGVSKIELGNE
jgi:hypothetical protein